MNQPIKTKPSDDGGSAFPHGEIIASQYDSAGNFSGNMLHHESTGMSLRDWFAGMALSGLYDDPKFDGSHKDAATCCYAVADAMLEARKAKP
jgi:uncharacterized protein YfaT (DUF1175 family)